MMIKPFLSAICFSLLLATVPVQAAQQPAQDTAFHEQYHLQKMLILSRHNIRSPIGTKLNKITPHKWVTWTSAPGELSLRGGQLETIMGQYFRKRLVADGLIAENEQPKEGEVRFYANSLQRTIATAQYFSSGMLPVANVPIEHHAALGTMDPVFNMRFGFMNDAYHAKAMEQIAAIGGTRGFDGINDRLAESYRIIDEVLDYQTQPVTKKTVEEGLPKGPFNVILEQGHSPYSVNYRKAEYLASDALVLQYYEEPNDERAAFNHKLTQKDWQAISNVKDTGIEVLCGTPLVAMNIAHPLLQVMHDELALDNRKFTFLCGHDTNLASVLAALDVAPYTLPQSIERNTPIGAKFVIEKWHGRDGQDYASLTLVYQSSEQLRNRTMLSLDTPPMIFPLTLKGLTKNADGLYRFRDVQQRFQTLLEAYDQLANETTRAEKAA